MVANEAALVFFIESKGKGKALLLPKSKRETVESFLKEAPINIVGITMQAAENENVESSCNFFHTQENFCLEKHMCFKLVTCLLHCRWLTKRTSLMSHPRHK